MRAHAQVLRREVDVSTVIDAAHSAIGAQRRGMVRGVVGVALLVGLCVALYARTGDTAILLPALSMISLGAYAILHDSLRLTLMVRWAKQPPRLDVQEARADRTLAVLKLAGSGVLVYLTTFLPAGLRYVLDVVGIVGILYYVFVIRMLTTEIKALRD